MFLDVAAVAGFLAFGNVLFRPLDPFLPLSRRVLKTFAALTVTALLSYAFGHTGVLVAFGLTMVPLLYIHAIWLPRNGVNGWTGEPKEKYYALRGWSVDENGKLNSPRPRPSPRGR